MAHIIETEISNNKKVILPYIIDYDSNIANNIISEDKKLGIEKLNEEFRNIVRKGKLKVSIGNEF